MAPRKKTEDKPTVKSIANEQVDAVLNYLRRENRPYSANDISANLHNKVTKTAAVKILKDLHERNEIEGRVAGKQIVYHAIQNPEDSCTPEQLAALDTAAAELRAKTAALVTTTKTLRSTLASLNSTLSTADLVVAVHALEAEKTQIAARLEGLSAGAAKKMTKSEREEAEVEWKKWGACARKRKKICESVWEVIEEVVGEKEKSEELREKLGLDE